MNFYIKRKRLKQGSSAASFAALLLAIMIPTEGKARSSTNRSVFIEGMQSFTVMTNLMNGLTANKVIDLNGEWSFASTTTSPTTYSITWTNSNGQHRIIEEKTSSGVPPRVRIQTKNSANAWISSALLSKTNQTIATVFKNPTNWVWSSSAFPILGGSTSVNFSNMFMTQASNKERKQVRELSQNLSFTNGRWRPQ